jgi:uroporphyrinogen-III synthase
VLHGPTIRTLSLGPDVGMRSATERIIAEPPAIVIANTGIGMRGWFAAADSWGLGEALFDALTAGRIYARGPKAATAVHEWGLDVVMSAPSERLDELIELIAEREPLAGATVLFQRHGEAAPRVVDALRHLGANVEAVSVYAWTLPDDDRPAARLIDAIVAGRVHAVTFTSAPAVRNLVALARARDLDEVVRDSFGRGRVLAACVGPVCAAAASAVGFGPSLVPDRFRLGPLIRRLTDHLHSSGHRVDLGDRTIALRGTVADIDGHRIVLTSREAGVLAGLAARSGRVVSKDALRRDIWGDDGDTRVVEVTVARLRRRLGGVGVRIVAVPRRGYLLDGRPA